MCFLGFRYRKRGRERWSGGRGGDDREGELGERDEGKFGHEKNMNKQFKL